MKNFRSSTFLKRVESSVAEGNGKISEPREKRFTEAHEPYYNPSEVFTVPDFSEKKVRDERLKGEEG